MSQPGYLHVNRQGLNSDDNMSQLDQLNKLNKGRVNMMSQPDQEVELFENTLFNRMKERNITEDKNNTEKENADIKVLKTNQGRTSSIRKLFETTSKTSDRTRGLKRLENNTPKKDRNRNQSTPVSTKTKRKRKSKKDVKSYHQLSLIDLWESQS